MTMFGVGFAHFSVTDAAPYMRVRANKWRVKKLEVL